MSDSGTSDAERELLAAFGVEIDLHPLDANLHTVGAVVVLPDEERIWVAAVHDWSDERAEVAEFALARLRRLFEHGPEPDGWQRSAEGGWQLYYRWRELDPALAELG